MANSDKALRKQLHDVRASWGMQWDACMVCGIRLLDRWHDFKVPKQHTIHHVMGRFGHISKWEQPYNWMFVCEPCHAHYHCGSGWDERGRKLDALTLEHMLWIKREHGDWNPDALAAIRGFRCLKAPPEKPPAWVYADRQRYGYVVRECC